MTAYPFDSFVSAQPVTVIGEVAGRGGKKLFVCRRADGTEMRVARLDTPIEFAPACTAEEFFAPLPSSARALRAKINR